MKRVLVVDDEADMLWMLQRNLNKGMDNVEILAAKSGEEALAILSDKEIDLVISDINMPGMSGLDLLVEINNRYPQTGVIIMTAYPSNTYESQAMLSGSLRFVEKPFDIKEMRQIVSEALHTDEGFQGIVDGVDLMDIVQFNGLSRATAALKVATQEKEGMIFFKNGEVVHAMCDSESGESAFFKILTFQGGSLQNIRGVEPPVMSIKKGLESLLLEAANRSDNLEEEQAEAEIEVEVEMAVEVEVAEETAAELNQEPLSQETNPDLDFDFMADKEETEQEIELPEDEVLFEDNHAPQEVEVMAEFQPEDIPEVHENIVVEQPVEPVVDTALQDNYSAEIYTEQEQVTYEEEEIAMTSIQKILAEFTSIEGVHTACLVGRDGFLLDSLARPGIDAEMIGAIASSGFGSAESMGNQLGQGELNMTMFEYGSGPVMFAPVGTEAFLVIVADQDTNLGWIRIAIKKNSKAIEDAVSL